MPRYSDKPTFKKYFPLWCEECQDYMYVKALIPPTRRKHECGNWAVQKMTIASERYVSDDKKKRRFERYERDGMDKSQAHAFYDTSIAGINKRIEGVGGASHYKRVTPDMDHMVKHGIAKPMSDKNVAEAQKARKEIVTKVVGKNKKFLPGRSNNSQSSK